MKKEKEGESRIERREKENKWKKEKNGGNNGGV